MAGKSLVLLDTNQIRLEEHMERDYSKCELKGFILDLIKYIEDSGLEDQIKIIIPEMVFEEVLESKKNNFKKTQEILENKISTIKTQANKLNTLDGIDLSIISFPKIEINYKNIFNEKLSSFFSSKDFIEVVKISDKENLLNKVLHRAINHIKPFASEGDKGFKDAIIWESFLDYDKIDEFDYFYVVTDNHTDFTSDLEDEFKILKKRSLKILGSITILKENLNKFYYLYEDFPELMKTLRKEYLHFKIKEMIAENSEFEIEDIKIINFCAGVSKVGQSSISELEELGLSVEEEDVEYISEVNMEIKIKDIEYNLEIIYDVKDNQILDLNYSPKEIVEIGN